MPTELVERLINKADMQGIYLIAQNMYEHRNNVDFFQNKLGIVPKLYDNGSVIFLKE